MGLRRRLAKTKNGIILIIGIILFTTGYVDNDWMVTSYRYSEWHRTEPVWHYCPYFSLPWWYAYIFNMLRIIVGAFIIGAYVVAQTMQVE